MPTTRSGKQNLLRTAIANFISFLNHKEYPPEQVRAVINDVERDCIISQVMVCIALLTPWPKHLSACRWNRSPRRRMTPLPPSRAPSWSSRIETRDDVPETHDSCRAPSPDPMTKGPPLKNRARLSGRAEEVLFQNRDRRREGSLTISRRRQQTQPH